MTMQPSSSASGTGLLASLRVQAQVNGGPQGKADLEIYQGGLAISWSNGLFGQKASSNPEDIIIRWPDLLLAHISGLPASEYSDPEPFARLRIAEGPPVITLFSEKHVRLTCRPTFSNDPAAFVLEVRAIAAGLMADNTRKFEAKMAAWEERRFQDKRNFIIERARRYVSLELYMASVRCRLVLPDGEISGHAILFYGQLCFFDQVDISTEDTYSRDPIMRYPGHMESCEVRTPKGVTLNGRGVPLYSASTLPEPDIYLRMSFGPSDDMTLKVPYASLSPARQKECVESLNEILKAIAETYADYTNDA